MCPHSSRDEPATLPGPGALTGAGSEAKRPTWFADAQSAHPPAHVTAGVTAESLQPTLKRLPWPLPGGRGVLHESLRELSGLIAVGAGPGWAQRRFCRGKPCHDTGLRDSPTPDLPPGTRTLPSERADSTATLHRWRSLRRQRPRATGVSTIHRIRATAAQSTLLGRPQTVSIPTARALVSFGHYRLVPLAVAIVTAAAAVWLATSPEGEVHILAADSHDSSDDQAPLQQRGRLGGCGRVQGVSY